MPEIEYHPLPPFLPEGARIVMLGSFPPPRARWSMEFFYPNMQNDMWRIVGLAFFGERDHFLLRDGVTGVGAGVATGKHFDRERIAAFCAERGIALGDTARAVVRHAGNASDAMLEVVEPLDLVALLDRIPACRHIAVTGQKAVDTLLEIVNGSDGGKGATGGADGSPEGEGGKSMGIKARARAALVVPPSVGGSAEFDFAGREMTLWRMPSSSRAYPLSLDKKAEAYRRMFTAVL